MDFNATTPLAPEVVESITESMVSNWFNPSSKYEKTQSVKLRIEESRASIAKMINAPSSNDILFVSGGTEVICIIFILHSCTWP
jgi:cysteine sulfinate desulfinase/cysteine desulfurase-like protein